MRIGHPYVPNDYEHAALPFLMGCVFLSLVELLVKKNLLKKPLIKTGENHEEVSTFASIWLYLYGKQGFTWENLSIYPNNYWNR